MTVTSLDEISQLTRTKARIFLAGSMATGSQVNWRQTVIDAFGEKYHFLDPTNLKHDSLTDVEMRNHIKWEFDGLRIADFILLNFLPDSLSPISMVELGMYIASKKLIVVCPKEFYKWRYIDTLCKEHNTLIFNQLEEVLTGGIDTFFNTKTQKL